MRLEVDALVAHVVGRAEDRATFAHDNMIERG
jgi:hypothetical protein